MRPPNFLSTSANRASLSITQTLYDRRALDCTASRPLIQSLQQLMLLTGSSVRVRETLCIDGGLERLVQIMKETSKASDSMAPYKWHLCIQCLLNLGTRGSEKVRRRILEAGAIPVVATVLDNYLVANGDNLEFRGRDRTEANSTHGDLDAVMHAPLVNLFAQPIQQQSGDQQSGEQAHLQQAQNVQRGQPQAVTQAVTEQAIHQTQQGVQQAPQNTAQQTTQQAIQQAQPPAQVVHQVTHLSESDDSDPNVLGISRFVNGLLVPREQDVFWALEIIAFVSKYSHLRREIQETHLLPQLSLRSKHELYENGKAPLRMNASMSTGVDSTMDHILDHRLDHTLDPAMDPALDAIMDPMMEEMMEVDFLGDKMEVDHVGIVDQLNSADQFNPSTALGDTLLYNLSLAKLIPLTQVEPNPKQLRYYQYNFENQVDYDDEHMAKHINLFELVERFTKFRFPREFPYWACIIMRNFVRKDEDGIRQCANFACGKWEDYPRQFAKCRRCKRTKYCSKACQLKAWSMHRYWCAPSPSSSSQTAGQDHEGH